MNDIETKVKSTIRKIVRMPKEEEIPTHSQLADIGVDSFAGIELVFNLEDVFNINITDEEASQMKTVRDVINGVETKLSFKM